MIWLLQVVASASCVDAYLTDAYEAPYTVRGNVTYSGEVGTFVQQVHGDRLRLEIEVGAVRRLEIHTPDRTLEQEHPGPASIEKAKPTDHVMAMWSPTLPTLRVDGDGSCETVELVPVSGPPVSVGLSPEGHVLTRRRDSACFARTITATNSDFRTVLDGLTLPHRVSYQSGKRTFLDYEVATVEAGVSDGAFDLVEPENSAEVAEVVDVTLPFQVIGERDHVWVQIEGPKGTLEGWMLIDTGWAASTNLTAEAAEAVGWTLGGQREAIGVAGSSTTQEGRLPFLRLGDWELENVQVATLASRGGSPDERIIGTLSVDLFAGHVVTLDPKARTLRVAGSVPPMSEDTVSLPMEWQCGAPAVKATFGPFAGWWGVDTGAFTSHRKVPTADLKAAVAEFPGARRHGVQGVGGSKSAWIVKPGPMELAGHRVENADLLMLGDDNRSTWSDRQGMFGHRVLHCFRTTFDFPGGALHLTPVADLESCAMAPPKPFNPLSLICFAVCPGLPIMASGWWVLSWVRRRRRYARLDMEPL